MYVCMYVCKSNFTRSPVPLSVENLGTRLAYTHSSSFICCNRIISLLRRPLYFTRKTIAYTR